MSSVDHDTETLLQYIIETEFKHTTNLAVMHRSDHVTRYDKVARLENGQLVEFDKVALIETGGLVEFDGPVKLIEEDSRFTELWRASNKDGARNKNENEIGGSDMQGTGISDSGWP